MPVIPTLPTTPISEADEKMAQKIANKLDVPKTLVEDEIIANNAEVLDRLIDNLARQNKVSKKEATCAVRSANPDMDSAPLQNVQQDLVEFRSRGYWGGLFELITSNLSDRLTRSFAGVKEEERILNDSKVRAALEECKKDPSVGAPVNGIPRQTTARTPSQ